MSEELPIWRVNAAVPGLDVPFFIRAAQKPTHDEINQVWMRRGGRKLPLKDLATLTLSTPLRECYPGYAGVDLIEVHDLHLTEDNSSDLAVAIGEHAFRAGFKMAVAQLDNPGRPYGAEWLSAEETAWSEYDPPEELKGGRI